MTAHASGNARKVFVTTVPKSGTHLLDSILGLMPGMRRQGKLGLNAKLRWHPLNFLPFVGGDKCWVGIGRPQEVKMAAVRHALKRIRPGHYGMGQVPYQQCIVDLLVDLQIAPVVAIRDPRDVVVSLMHHSISKPQHFLHAALSGLRSEKERLRALIVGVRSSNGELRQGVAHQIDMILGWLKDPRVLTVRFEDLVGNQGGGSDAAQHRAINALALHIGIELAPGDVERIGRDMFGKGRTFRKGQIGAWAEVFDDELKQIFDQEVGNRILSMGYAS